MALIDEILRRAHDVLPEEGRVGLILPCYALQTAGRVVRYSESWFIVQEMIPRNIYSGLSKPLLFALFRKDRRRTLVGFTLYHEANHVLSLPKDIQQALAGGPATWPELVRQGLETLGGEAMLTDLYEYVASRRPTSNPHWRAQVRKVCQSKAIRTGKARYALSSMAG